MGWYTRGPGWLTFKYGNVHELARKCGLGEFIFYPRVSFKLPNGEYTEDPVFLSEFQQEIEKLKLPWPHVDFIDEGLKASPNKNLIDYVAIVKGIVVPNIQSIERYIKESYSFDEAIKISEIKVTIDYNWNLDKNDWPSFVDWLSIPMSEPLSIEKIGMGSMDEFDDVYMSYSLPDELVAKGNKLDKARDLGLTALGTAILINEELSLSQPDDDNQSRIEIKGEQSRIVLE